MNIAKHTIELLPHKRDLDQVRKSWKQDIIAGLTVGIVALPLALAFGVASGVGAAEGMVTAIIAGTVAAIFGGSNLQVSGPTGALAVILAPLAATYGPGVMPVVAFMAGIIVLLGGILGVGKAISLIPWPVVEGFTLGIAIVIFLQQVPNALGVSVEARGNTAMEAVDAISQVTSDSLIPLAMTVISVLLILGLAKLNPKIPGSLVAVVIMTIVVATGVISTPTIGEIPSSLPSPVMPVLSIGVMSDLMVPAFAVALIAGIESLLSARVAAGMVVGGQYHPDRELAGQGLASMASGLFGGMPACGAIARTAVNVRSGGRSRLSPLVHSAFLLVIVYFASTLVAMVPMAVLAAVLIVTSLRMSSIGTIKKLLGSTRSDATVFLMTAFITVAFDLLYAIGIGLVVANFMILRRLSRWSGVFREELPEDPRIAILRIDGAMFWGVADRIEQEISRLADVDVVILRLSRVGVMDATGAKTLADLVLKFKRQGKTIVIMGLQPGHVKLAEGLGLIDAIGASDHFFEDNDEALEYARMRIRQREDAEERAREDQWRSGFERGGDIEDL